MAPGGDRKRRADTMAEKERQKKRGEQTRKWTEARKASAESLRPGEVRRYDSTPESMKSLQRDFKNHPNRPTLDNRDPRETTMDSQERSVEGRAHLNFLKSNGTDTAGLSSRASVQLVERSKLERVETALAGPPGRMSDVAEHHPEHARPSEGGEKATAAKGALDGLHLGLDVVNGFKDNRYKTAVFTWQDSQGQWRARVYQHVPKMVEQDHVTGQTELVKGYQWQEAPKDQAQKVLGVN